MQMIYRFFLQLLLQFDYQYANGNYNVHGVLIVTDP